MNSPTIARYIGTSRDQRTNRWSITCPSCGKVFEPETTMRSTQHLQCPAIKCRANMVAQYNDEQPTVKLMTP